MAPPRRLGSALAINALALALALAAPAAAISQALPTAPVAPTAPAAPIVAPRAGEPTPLPALLERVLARDPQVQVAQGLYGIAQERLRQARSRLLPTAGLAFNRGQAVDVDRGFEVDRRTERSEALLRWNAYNGGSDSAEIGAAETEVAAAAEDLRRAREDVAERVASAYLDLLRHELLVPRSADRLRAIEGYVQQVRRQAELGRVAPSDFEQADASLTDAELAHALVLSERDAASQRLAVLTTEPPMRAGTDGLAALVGPPSAPPPGDDIPGSLRAAQLRAQAARERVRNAMTVLAPRLDLEARYRLHDNTYPPPATDTKSGWSASVRWEMPLGGETFARRNEIEHRAEASEAEALRLEQGLRAELAGLQPRIAHGERVLQSLARQIEQYGRLLRAGELQFEAGRRSMPQLIELRETQFGAEQRLADQANRLAQDRLRRLALTGHLLPALGQARSVDPPEPLPLVPPPTPGAADAR